MREHDRETRTRAHEANRRLERVDQKRRAVIQESINNWGLLRATFIIALTHRV